MGAGGKIEHQHACRPSECSSISSTVPLTALPVGRPDSRPETSPTSRSQSAKNLLVDDCLRPIAHFRLRVRVPTNRQRNQLLLFCHEPQFQYSITSLAIRALFYYITWRSNHHFHHYWLGTPLNCSIKTEHLYNYYLFEYDLTSSTILKIRPPARNSPIKLASRSHFGINEWPQKQQGSRRFAQSAHPVFSIAH